MLSVCELARDLELELLSGDDAADAPLRWVHISELADPTPWLSGGELLLTTGMALGTADEHGAYVDRLSDRGVAGLGLGLGFGYDDVPESLLAEARVRHLPVFCIPYELPFIAVTERAFAQLVNEQYAVLRRSIAALERLQRIVLAERGLDALAGALATLLGGAALVFDARGQPLARRTFHRELDDEDAVALAAQLRGRARDARTFAPHHGELTGRALALPVPGGPHAWLVAIKDAGGLSDFDRLLLHQAVTVVALELLRRRVADTTERRLAGDLLAEVVAGALEGPELARRLEPFGLRSRVSALVFDADENAVEEALREEAVDGVVARVDELTGALVPGCDDDELYELGERVRARVGGRGGAGRSVAAGDARRAFHEARCALEALALGNGVGHTRLATARDLGSFQLLLALQDSDALKLFCDTLLAPIEHGEGHYGGELMRSLEAFIEANAQGGPAGRRFSCHRHTLRYRIRRIEELTGRDLGSARDRIEFWLAIRGRELVS